MKLDNSDRMEHLFPGVELILQQLNLIFENFVFITRKPNCKFF
jgi:hypothetical protein